jgi:hypothetical protein
MGGYNQSVFVFKPLFSRKLKIFARIRANNHQREAKNVIFASLWRKVWEIHDQPCKKQGDIAFRLAG